MAMLQLINLVILKGKVYLGQISVLSGKRKLDFADFWQLGLNFWCLQEFK